MRMYGILVVLLWTLNNMVMADETLIRQEDVNLVIQMMNNGEYEEALKFWRDKSIYYANGNGYYENLLGHILVDVGQMDEAERSLLRSLELGWRGPGLFMNLSTVYRRKNDLSRAAHWAEKAIQDYSSVPWGYSALAEVRFAERRWEEAKLLTKRELKLSPNPIAFRRLGHLEMILGEYHEAIESLGRAMELEPNYRKDIFIVFLFADAHLQTGNPAAARDIVQKLWQVNPAARNHERIWSLMNEIEAKLDKP